MPLALSTGNSIALALVAGVFVVFALISALVVPRRWPQFPGERGLGWFIAVTAVLCVGTLAAVNTFAKEASEESAETQPGTTSTTSTSTTSTTTTSATEPPAAPQGDPAAGKSLFAAQGCGGCHAFGPAGSNGSVGPALDEALDGKDAGFIHESIVDPNKEIAQGYQPNIMPSNFEQTLTPKQIDDLVAFLSQPS